MYGALAAAGLGRHDRAALGARGAPPRALSVRWGLYALAMAVPPYLHHFGWMIFAFHGAFVALAVWRYRARALPWLAAVAAATLAYVPWLGPLARQVARLRDTPDFWQGALSLWFVAQHAFAAFAVGFGGALERYAVVLALFVGVFVARRAADRLARACCAAAPTTCCWCSTWPCRPRCCTRSWRATRSSPIAT